jgi:hypothetical protein
MKILDILLKNYVKEKLKDLRIYLNLANQLNGFG